MTPMPGGGDAGSVPMLEPFDPSSRAALGWVQLRRFGSLWQLRSGDRTFGLLRGTGSFGRPVVLEFAHGTYELRHHLFGGVSVGVAGAEPIARVRAGAFGAGPVEVSGERRYTLRRVGFLASSWELRTLDDMPLVRFAIRRTFFRVGADLAFEDAAARVEHLPELLGLCWFAILNTRRHAHG